MPSSAPPNPVVRFGLRTLLMLTTVTAILAAIAGPVYRAAESVGRRSLLMMWGMVFAYASISFGFRYYEAFRGAMNNQARFLVYRSAGRSVRARGWILVLGVIAVLSWLAVTTYLMGFTHMPSKGGLVNSPWYHGFLIGGAVAGMIINFVRRPMRLREDGIPLGKGAVAPWKFIRGAEWAASAPNVMKLRRYDGDIYLEVPPAIRDEVEAFVREKIGVDMIASAKS